jgi:hypothetical protein
MATTIPLADELSLALLFVAIWASGVAMGFVRSSPLLGYILAGAFQLPWCALGF